MALMTTGDVITRVQALLDDPAGRRFSPDYLRPHIDQANEDLQIMLERLGVENEQRIAIFNVPAAAVQGPSDLTPYLAAGQPLQYMLRPQWLDWKIQGQPDVSYLGADSVDKLDDVIVGNVGCQQYNWSGGTIYTTPSYSGVTLRIGFLALTASIYDSSAQIMRGIGNIIALQAADFVCALNNDMGKLSAKMTKRLSTAKRNFANLIVMQQQTENRFPRGTKRGVGVQISAGGQQFI